MKSEKNWEIRDQQDSKKTKLEANKVESSHGKKKNIAESSYRHKLKTKFAVFAVIRQQLLPFGGRNGPTWFEFLFSDSYTELYSVDQN